MKKLFLRLLEALRGPHRDCPTCHGLSSVDPTNGCGLCGWCYGVKTIEVDMDTLPCVTIKASLRFRFVPLRDITVYELACLLPYMMSEMPFYQEDYDRLGPDVQRHLQRIE